MHPPQPRHPVARDRRRRRAVGFGVVVGATCLALSAPGAALAASSPTAKVGDVVRSGSHRPGDVRLRSGRGGAASGSTSATTLVGATTLPGAGLYAGPGTRTTSAVAGFASWSGVVVKETLDFPPDAAWDGSTGLTGPSWLLGAHQGAPQRLEYSLPLFPAVAGASLERCAAGEYDAWWSLTGRNLVSYGLAGSIVRPGWEFNGSWYRWSAVGRTTAYVACFRRVVTAMRAVPGSAFTFDWNPNVGSNTLKAELAYPGDAYVDHIGLDVYDTSWSWYPTPAGTTTQVAREKAWAWIARGDHGLVFWRDFAAAHGKPLAVPEWASTLRADGHGGGDNTYFMTQMLQWMADPANRVGYWHYFDLDAGSVRHSLTVSGTAFPQSAATFRATAKTLTAR